jgi:EAL domain-containing protein (putative c-di-GMP-specific phosphodiesterase class I)/CheY-like chemotaxis protein
MDEPVPQVLVVEPDPAARAGLVQAIGPERCGIVEAPTAAEALAILARQPVDLVLLALTLPPGERHAVLAAVTAPAGPFPPTVVALAAPGDRAAARDVLGRGATAVLAAPPDPVEVGALVRGLVGLARRAAVRDTLLHHLNNHLLVVLLFAGAARDGLADGDARRGDLGEVLRAAERGAELTRQLLGAARVSAPAPAPPPAAAEGPAEPAGPAPPPGAGERVLLVEDDRSVAEIGARILRRSGLQVTVAHTLAAARRALAGAEFDAVVSDVGLPDGSGFDLLRYTPGTNAVTPVILITGTPSVDAAATAVRLRASNYVQKPVRPDELVRAVGAAIAEGRLARLRARLLAARFGGDEFVGDMAGTERRLATALAQLRLEFQPIRRSRDGSVFGYEALARCDESSLASPPRLLAAAEVLSRVPDVGRVVRARLAAILTAPGDTPRTVFVNLHPSELRGDLLVEATDPLRPLARRVVLEVTERAALERGPVLDEALRQARSCGYRLAVDDLGEGYAGLASLASLQPDFAKIDMSLVRDVDRAPLKQDIIGAIVHMARKSGIMVVAEGVETAAEQATLVGLEVDLLQGYHLGRPGPYPPDGRGA